MKADIQIDGVRLVELARVWEAINAPEPQLAGKYGGIPYYYGNLVQPWQEARADAEKTTLLVCTCGEPGCWSLEARIAQQGAHMLWTDFQHPNRRDTWSYAGFGPFVFDADQYAAQVQALIDSTPTE